MDIPEKVLEQPRLIRGSSEFGTIVPRSRLILSHASVLLVGIALGAWLASSATRPDNNSHSVSTPSKAGTSASDTAGRGEPTTDTPSIARETHDSAPITGETYIRIPLRLAEHFSLPVITEPKLDDLLVEVLELSLEQRHSVDELLEQTSARLKQAEFQNMTVETPEAGGVLIKIPQMKDYAHSKGAFKEKLASIIGEAKAGFFMEAARPSLHMSLSGEFGEFARDIHITPTTSGYAVREDSFSISVDGTKHDVGNLATTFEDELPARLKHLVELLQKR